MNLDKFTPEPRAIEGTKMNQTQVYEHETGQRVITLEYKNEKGHSIAVHKVGYVVWLETKVNNLEKENKALQTSWKQVNALNKVGDY